MGIGTRPASNHQPIIRHVHPLSSWSLDLEQAVFHLDVDRFGLDETSSEASEGAAEGFDEGAGLDSAYCCGRQEGGLFAVESEGVDVRGRATQRAERGRVQGRTKRE